jgi:hypothetical protein
MAWLVTAKEVPLTVTIHTALSATAAALVIVRLPSMEPAAPLLAGGA